MLNKVPELIMRRSSGEPRKNLTPYSLMNASFSFAQASCASIHSYCKSPIHQAMKNNVCEAYMTAPDELQQLELKMMSLVGEITGSHTT